ncbi:hypothetical protein BOTCAL_0090g00180 [Botryotinia calthae]|uniref:Uncharacterized protein n=1 Tax=Botryotinia calthae TaxID=38488 RepID=A0A4Y8D725_9HELO|nr:hypothetical protein BOTCAL_0090g00180 [Botryotinia calthae]
MAGVENHDALHSICGLENFHLATQSHKRHPRSDDFPCCFEGRCLNEFDYFKLKWFICKGGSIEEHKRKWYSQMNLLEQQVRAIITRPRLESPQLDQHLPIIENQ